MPVAILFLDIRTAFYRVIRPLAAKIHEDQTALREILRRFNLPPSAFQDLLEHLKEPSAVRQFDVPVFAEEFLAECHESTWFEVPGAPGTVETATGTRPGDPLADITFNFVFTRILRSMQTELEEAGLVFALEWSGVKSIFPERHGGSQTVQLLEAVWADDLALLVHAFKAPELLPRVRAVVQKILDRCLSHALEPNLKAGKTEVLVAMRGPGSVAERKNLYATAEPMLEVEGRHWGKVHIRIVKKYQHLGGQVNAKGDDGPEIISRFAQAKKVQQKYGRSLFRSADVSLDKRTMLLSPLVLSVMQFGLGTWANYRDKTWTSAKQKLHVMYRALLRSELPYDQWIQLSQEEVLARLQLPSLDVMTHVARLRHLGALVKKGHAAIWAILDHEQGWLQRARESGAWLWENLSSTLDCGPFDEDWDSWAQLMIHKPGRYKGLLRRAQLHAVLKQARDWATRHWHCFIMESLEAIGLQPGWRTTTGPKSSAAHLCGPCQKMFASHSAWSVHAFRKHGRIVYLRAFIQGCLSCATEYWSTSRLLRHLQYKRECASFYLAHFRPGEVGPGLNSQYFNRNGPPVLAPPCETAVPIFPEQGFHFDDPEGNPHGPLIADLVTLLDLDLQQCDDYSPSSTMWSLVERVRRELLRHPISYSQLLLTLRRFFESWAEMLEDECPEVRDIWQHVFNVVQWRICPAWLIPYQNFLSCRTSTVKRLMNGSSVELHLCFTKMHL